MSKSKEKNICVYDYIFLFLQNCKGGDWWREIGNLGMINRKNDLGKKNQAQEFRHIGTDTAPKYPEKKKKK